MLRTVIRTMATAETSKKPPISLFGVEGRYVNSLYSAASQKNELDGVEKGLRDLQKILKKPNVMDFLETSLISRAEKSKLLSAVANEAGIPATGCNFLGLVAENGRLKMLRRMINMFLRVMVAHRNETLCEIITAEPLDDSTKKALMDVLQKFNKESKNIKLTEKVDPSIIGGLVVGFEDKHIDLSIARRFQVYSDILKQTI